MKPASQFQTEIIYPESDGTPMGETDQHITLLLYLLAALRDHFRDDPQVYVAGNMFLYYEEGDPASVVAPDVFMVRGVGNHRRRTYRLWEEGRGPDVVFELTSRSTRLDDLGTKRALYAMLGVSEYYIFDPFSEYLEPRLWAYRLESPGPNAEYVRLMDEPVYSPALGVHLVVEDDFLRLRDAKTGQNLLTMLEAQAARRVEAAARQAETESRRAAEAEAAQLREEVARLKAKLGEED